MPVTMFDLIRMGLEGLHDPEGSTIKTLKAFLEDKWHFSCKTKNNREGLEEGLRKGVAENKLELIGDRYKIVGHVFAPGTVAFQLPPKPKRMTKKRVNELLRGMGVEDPERVSCCLKGGIQKGHIKVKGEPSDLKQVILRGRLEDYGLECNHELVATIEKLLYQPDYGGHDYEMGSEDATVHCTETDEDGEECPSRMYVTNLCEGDPRWNGGKFHNHCSKCTKRSVFGVCKGDYRDAHCDGCGRHYWGTLRGCQNRACPEFDNGSDSDEDGDGARPDCQIM